MEWESYFEPIANYVLADEFDRSQLASNIHYHGLDKSFPDLDQPFDIAILGVGYDQSDLSAPLNKTSDDVRYWLYRLYKSDYHVRIADLGNLKFRSSTEEVTQRLAEIQAFLMNRGILPVIIGGGKELTYGNYLAYKKLQKFATMLGVSSTLSFREVEGELSAANYLNTILSDPENYLFSYANLGYQTYFTPPELLELFRSFHFEMIRLGEVRSHMENTEPVIRNADAISFDLGAVKYADAPHTTFGTPNGLSSDEICRLARYAGLSRKCSSVGFYGIKPGGKTEWPDHQLMAQVIWYFLEGFYVRKPESMDVNDSSYLKFHVALQGHPDEINFYKNLMSEKWWMAVPVPGKGRKKYALQEYLIPCSEADYQTASLNIVPDRWMEYYQKFHD